MVTGEIPKYIRSTVGIHPDNGTVCNFIPESYVKTRAYFDWKTHGEYGKYDPYFDCEQARQAYETLRSEEETNFWKNAKKWFRTRKFTIIEDERYSTISPILYIDTDPETGHQIDSPVENPWASYKTLHIILEKDPTQGITVSN